MPIRTRWGLLSQQYPSLTCTSPSPQNSTRLTVCIYQRLELSFDVRETHQQHSGSLHIVHLIPINIGNSPMVLHTSPPWTHTQYKAGMFDAFRSPFRKYLYPSSYSPNKAHLPWFSLCYTLFQKGYKGTLFLSPSVPNLPHLFWHFHSAFCL